MQKYNRQKKNKENKIKRSKITRYHPKIQKLVCLNLIKIMKKRLHFINRKIIIKLIN